MGITMLVTSDNSDKRCSQTVILSETKDLLDADKRQPSNRQCVLSVTSRGRFFANAQNNWRRLEENNEKRQ